MVRKIIFSTFIIILYSSCTGNSRVQNIQFVGHLYIIISQDTLTKKNKVFLHSVDDEIKDRVDKVIITDTILLDFPALDSEKLLSHTTYDLLSGNDSKHIKFGMESIQQLVEREEFSSLENSFIFNFDIFDKKLRTKRISHSSNIKELNKYDIDYELHHYQRKYKRELQEVFLMYIYYDMQFYL